MKSFITCIALFSVLAFCSAMPAEAQRRASHVRHSWGHRMKIHTGHYVGGRGSSHKGGHYVNSSSHNHYKKHR